MTTEDIELAKACVEEITRQIGHANVPAPYMVIASYLAMVRRSCYEAMQSRTGTVT